MAKVKIQVPATITNYFTCDVANNTQFDIGTSVTIHLTAKKYYGTTTLPYIRWLSYGQEYGDHINFTQVDNKHWILTSTFNEYGTAADRTVQIQCTGTQEMYFALDCESLVQCTSDYPTGEYEPSDITTLTVTAPSNYEFPQVPYLYWKVGTTEHTELMTQVDEQTYSVTFTFQIGKTYSVIGEAVHKTVVSDKYGLITAYRVTKEELIEIAGKRWIERTYAPQTYQGVPVLFIADDKYIDTAKYVVSVFKIFMDLNVGEKENLYFGPYNLDMQCDVIDTDIATMDFGSVAIVGTYQNNIDFDHTTIEIYLPFIGLVNLNTADFMDKTVNLKYQVNVLTGDSVAYLTVEGKVLYTGTCNITFQIPYQLGGNEYVSTGITAPSNVLEDTPPYILIKTGIALQPDSQKPYKDTKFYAKFGDLTGYTEADEIDFEVLSTQITKTEIDEIIQLLHNGVFL